MKNTISRVTRGSTFAASENFKPGLVLPLVICILFAGRVHALNWEGSYGVNITAGNNDNLLLVEPTAGELDTSFSKLGLFVSTEGSSELTSVQIRFGIDSDEYSAPSVEDRTTGNLSFSLSNQGERLQTGLEASLLSEPTIETELLDSNIIVDSTRDTLNVSPSMTYQIDERNSLSISLGFTDVSYDTGQFTEYQDSSLSLGWDYRLNETSDFSTSLSFSQYDPDSTDSTDTSSLNLGYVMRPSETTTYSFSIGYSDVDRPVNDQTGSTYSVAVNNIRDERNSFALTAARSFQASGLGVVREEDKLDLSWTHAFSEKVQGVLSAVFVGTEDRDYFEIQPRISYRISENLSISGNYRFRKQDKIAENAESSSLLITLTYQR